MHIRTRNDLIKWLENNASFTFRSIARALVEGKYEVLGAFDKPNAGGWIVTITSRFNKVWHTYVQPIPVGKPFGPTYGTILIEKVPWKYWIGDKSRNPLYQGDNPDEYKRLRDKELQK